MLKTFTFMAFIVLFVACTAAPTPDIEATVDARVTYEFEMQATIDAAVANALEVAVTSTPIPLPTATPRPTTTPRPTPTPLPTATPAVRPSTQPITSTSQDMVVAVGKVGGWGTRPAWYSFEMEATFHNPHGISTNHWDYGFGFHSNGATLDHIFLTSRGQWFHSVKDKAAWFTVDKGTFDASLLSSNINASNMLKLTVDGAQGKFYANGMKVADIRVSSSPRGSGLGVAACILSGSCLRPAIVKVTDFRAAPLE